MRDFIIKLAVAEAEKSRHTKYRLGAVVFQKKTILAAASNKPIAWSKRLTREYQPWPTSVHAELAALLAARHDLDGADLLVVRIGRDGRLLMSRPCRHCCAYMQHVGIRNVTYSDVRGNLVTAKLDVLLR